MTGKQEKLITERIKIYESIKILNNANKELVKKEIHKEICLTNKQYISLNRKINVLKAVLLFLKKKCFIKDVASELKLAPSCIQRYLNDPIIKEELGEEINSEIQEVLCNNLNKGRIKGSENYVLHNEAIKLENGKFAGSIKRM